MLVLGDRLRDFQNNFRRIPRNPLFHLTFIQFRFRATGNFIGSNGALTVSRDVRQNAALGALENRRVAESARTNLGHVAFRGCIVLYAIRMESRSDYRRHPALRHLFRLLFRVPMQHAILQIIYRTYRARLHVLLLLRLVLKSLNVWYIVIHVLKWFQACKNQAKGHSELLISVL